MSCVKLMRKGVCGKIVKALVEMENCWYLLGSSVKNCIKKVSDTIYQTVKQMKFIKFKEISYNLVHSLFLSSCLTLCSLKLF